MILFSLALSIREVYGFESSLTICTVSLDKKELKEPVPHPSKGRLQQFIDLILKVHP